MKYIKSAKQTPFVATFTNGDKSYSKDAAAFFLECNGRGIDEIFDAISIGKRIDFGVNWTEIERIANGFKNGVIAK